MGKPLTPESRARDLVELGTATFTQEIMPSLPKEKRYAGAMVANALGAAQRRLSHPDPDAGLVQQLDAPDMQSLAKSIRSGDVCDTTSENLRDALMTYLEAELAITNPKFLERRKGS